MTDLHDFNPVFTQIPARFKGTYNAVYNDIESKIQANPGEPLLVDNVNTWRDRNRWASAARYRKWGFAQRVTRDESNLKCWNIWVWWTPRDDAEEG